MLMSTLIAGLLIPNDEREFPQRDENSPQIPLVFPCLTIRCLSSSSRSYLPEENAFCNTYPMFTSDMRLVICTYDLQVGLL